MKVKIINKLTSTYNGFSEEAEVDNGDTIITENKEKLTFICRNCGDYFTVNIKELKQVLAENNL